MHHQRGLWLGRSFCFGVWILLLAAAASAQVNPHQPGAITGPDLRLGTPRPLETIVARADKRAFTIKDLQQYLQYNAIPGFSGQVQPDQVPALPEDKLLELARWVASREKAFAEIQQSKDPKLLQFTTSGIQQVLDKVIVMYIQDTVLMADNAASSAEAVKAYYDKNKTKFRLPFSFTMRQLLLQTYEPYVVREGDTLESIAEQISGDRKLADNLRCDNGFGTARREQGKVFKPLVAGEKLLAPMNAQKAEQVRVRLEGLLKELGNGKSFEDLAKKYSEDGMKGATSDRLPSGTRPMLPEIEKQARATAVGKLSPIFRTKHGYQVIQIVSKEEERQRPLEEVRNLVAADLAQQSQRKNVEDFVTRLFDNPQLKVNYELFAKGDSLTTSTVIASVGKAPVEWQLVKAQWESNNRPTDPVQIKNLLKRVSAFNILLAREWAQPLLADRQSTLSQQVRLACDGFMGSSLISKTAAERIQKQLTPERTRSYYEKHKEKNYRIPVMVGFASMVLGLEPEELKLKDKERDAAVAKLVARMKEALARVSTPASFINEAALINQSLRSRGYDPPEAEKPVPISQIGEPAIKEALLSLKPGQWSQPLIVDRAQVYSLLLRERQPERQMTYMQARDRVMYDIYKETINDNTRQVEDEYLKKSNFQFVLNPAPASAKKAAPGNAKDNVAGPAMKEKAKGKSKKSKEE